MPRKDRDTDTASLLLLDSTCSTTSLCLCPCPRLFEFQVSPPPVSHQPTAALTAVAACCTHPLDVMRV